MNTKEEIRNEIRRLTEEITRLEIKRAKAGPEELKLIESNLEILHKKKYEAHALFEEMMGSRPRPVNQPYNWLSGATNAIAKGFSRLSLFF